MASLLRALLCVGSALVAVVVPVAASAVAGPTLAVRSAAEAGRTLPLVGRTIVVDPGHQLGNSRHLRQSNALVDDGAGGRKACNTTGTATDAGYPEATFAWQVAVGVRDRLRALGATVVMTRASNSADRWGPCVDVRGRLGDAGYAGRRTAADLKLSIHGDGSVAGNRGFHVIVGTGPGERVASERYAAATADALVRAGFAPSNYVGGGTGFDHRGDLGTLNWSRIPTVMVELGNMRDPGDAARMTSSAGQRTYAAALADAARRFLAR
jgi:N-acetylmuramoyl-L-alanine amidase